MPAYPFQPVYNPVPRPPAPDLMVPPPLLPHAYVGPLAPNSALSSHLLAAHAAALATASGTVTNVDDPALIHQRREQLGAISNIRSRALSCGYLHWVETMANELANAQLRNADTPPSQRRSATSFEHDFARFLNGSEYDGNPMLHAEERTFLFQVEHMAEDGWFREPGENDSVLALVRALQTFRCRVFNNDDVRRRRILGEFGGVGQLPPVINHFHLAQ